MPRLSDLGTVILAFINLGLVDAHCSITGQVCNTPWGVSGICVPLDETGRSQDCYNVYGFLVLDVCGEQYGSDYTNVHSSEGPALLT